VGEPAVVIREACLVSCGTRDISKKADHLEDVVGNVILGINWDLPSDPRPVDKSREIDRSRRKTSRECSGE